MRTNENKLIRAFNSMETEFSSHQFTRAVRNEGVSDISITNGISATFLRKYCDHPSKFTWRKRSDKKIPLVVDATPPTQRKPDDFESECVEYLKGLGYRIYKMKEV